MIIVAFSAGFNLPGGIKNGTKINGTYLSISSDGHEERRSLLASGGAERV
jgi:hypothetical protein